MPNAEECRWETSEYEERQKQRVKRHKDRCKDYGLFDPRGWVCTVVTFFEEVWVTVTVTVREWVCTVVEVAEEWIEYGRRVLEWFVSIVDHWVGVLIGNDTGYWPIVGGEAERNVPSRPRPTTSTRSIAFGLSPEEALAIDAYDGSGTHIDIELREGAVWWRTPRTEWTLMAPKVSHIPPHLLNRVIAGTATAVSYDQRRLGEVSTPPRFDLVVASGDRVMAKVEGKDTLYIAILEHPYIHHTGSDKYIRLPQTYFKLDPECGRATARKDDLLVHIRVAHDDERHLATERFPLVRAAFDGTHWDFMATWFAPRIWHRIDARPRKDSRDPPSRYPSYEHVVYRGNLPPFPDSARRKPRRSIRYRRVLDLGIGVSHLHEQHDARFGGEMDSLSGQGGVTGQLLRPVREAIFSGTSFDNAYRFANGPIEDYGGWVDGTCIYFQFVELRSEAAAAAAGWSEAFAVLWADEQMVFTERWRVLHLFDREFQAIFQPMVGIASILEDEFYRDSPFDPDRYYCPSLFGHLRPWSRMAVARQFIALTGIDPATDAREIYTTHWAWGTMDKTWRRRAPPASSAASGDRETVAEDCDLDSLQLLDDSTLVLAGHHTVGGKRHQGFWMQRVLPASGQERPSVHTLGEEVRFEPRGTGFAHPWRFVGQNAFEIMRRRFRHMGVLEPVDSRIQMYRVELDDYAGLTSEAIENTIWLDDRHEFTIPHRQLDFEQAAAVLRSDGGAVLGRALDGWNNTRIERTHPSRYHRSIPFRLRHVGGLGWVLLFADLRDDKTIGGTFAEDHVLTLSPSGGADRQVRCRHLCHIRSARDPHGQRVTDERDGLSPPAVQSVKLVPRTGATGFVEDVAIEFRMARPKGGAHHPAYCNYREWVAGNVRQIKIGALHPLSGEPVLLAELDRETTCASSDDETWNGTWDIVPNQTLRTDLPEFLSPLGAVLHGTSVWFVGASGLAAPPDLTTWAR